MTTLENPSQPKRNKRNM